MLVSVTGLADFIGANIKEAITVPVDDINCLGGVLGRKIEFYYENDKNNPSNAVLAAKKSFSLRVLVVKSSA